MDSLTGVGQQIAPGVATALILIYVSTIIIGAFISYLIYTALKKIVPRKQRLSALIVILTATITGFTISVLFTPKILIALNSII